MRLVFRLRQKRGAVALLTLSFLVFAGLVALFSLWGIAKITGAYNALYAANQSAAYAAATAVESGAKIRCWNKDSNEDTICLKDNQVGEPSAYTVAEQVMQRALDPDLQHTFGLCYGDNCSGDLAEVKLVSSFTENGKDNAIKVFNMEYVQQSSAACNKSDIDDETDYALALDPGAALENKIACWGLREGGEIYTVQTTSGVIVRSEVSVPYLNFPGCNSASGFPVFVCPNATLRVQAAARQSQPQPGAEY